MPAAIGFILPDLPIEEATELFALATAKDLAPIILMTPTSSAARLRTLAAAARGFVYAVARKGVTGTATSMNDEVGVFLERCRANTSLPLAVGFGVSTREDMDFIAAHADIAIIGTAALRAWEANREQGLKDFFAGLGMSA